MFCLSDHVNESTAVSSEQKREKPSSPVPAWRQRRKTERDKITANMPSRRAVDGSHVLHSTIDDSILRLNQVASRLSVGDAISHLTQCHMKGQGSVLRHENRGIAYTEMDKLKDMEKIRQMPVGMDVKKHLR